MTNFYCSWWFKQNSEEFFLISTSACPHSHQRKKNTLKHVYTNTHSRCKALPDSHCCLLDHISLLSIYSQLMKRVKLSIETVRVWIDEATAALHSYTRLDWFECTGWHIFRDAGTMSVLSNIHQWCHHSWAYVLLWLNTKTIKLLLDKKPV